MNMSEYTLRQKKQELKEVLEKNPSLWDFEEVPQFSRVKKWRVLRDNDTPWPKFHEDARGNILWYSEEGALKKAIELNNEELECQKIRDSMKKGQHIRELVELREKLEKISQTIVLRARRDYNVDPELHRDLTAATDAFLAKSAERYTEPKTN